MQLKRCLLLAALFFTGIAPGLAQQHGKLTEAEALKLGTEAYIYGYPLITMDLMRRVMTNVPKVKGEKGPMGQFVNAREYPNASFKAVAAPNADTLYSLAWLDLSKEPYILHVPDESHRYYLMPILSAWTEVFAAPGTRTTGTKARDFAIVGPHWKGKLPEELTELKAPTNIVWILGRTYCAGTPEDYKAVHAIQDQYTLTPLSFYGKPYKPSADAVDSNIDMKTPIRDQVNKMDAATYFKNLATLVQANPPATADAHIVTKLASLGINPGNDFDISKVDPVIAKGLEAAVKAGQEKIIAHEKHAGVTRNGWTFSTKTGIYGIDYLQRAFIAAIGLGADRPQDAIYPVAATGSDGKSLNGANRYIIHFAKGQTPPVNAFWSLTMYNDKFFFAKNSLNRYALGSHDEFKRNADGAIDLYIQHDSPGKDKESNWLPAPSGNFILMFRFYWPKLAIIDEAWSPPVIEKQP